MSEIITGIIRKLSEQNGGAKFDAYYREGKGVLIVHDGAALRPENVLLAVSDFDLAIIGRRAAA